MSCVVFADIADHPGRRTARKTCSMPAVSVIMPVFNAAAFLQEAVTSVLQQSLQDLELVIVNDGSTDQSPAILDAFKDPRVRVLHQNNAGQSAAINRGVHASHGDFIKIVDADDWLNPPHLMAQLNSLGQAPNCVSACRWGYFHQAVQCPAVLAESTDRDYSDPLSWIVDSLTLDEGMMGGWKWLIPRAVWDRSGGYDERLSLNNDFHASIAILLASNGVRFAPEAVYSYRKGVTGALSGTRSRRSMESALLTTQLGCELLLQRQDSTKIRRICGNRFRRWAYDFFPEHPDLAETAEQRAQELGHDHVPFPGGRLAQSLAGLLGWRTVRKLQHWGGSMGLQYLRKRRAAQKLARLN